MKTDNRIDRYNFNDLILRGDHYAAFSSRISNTRFNEAYRTLSYLSTSLPARISELYSDLMFGRPIKVTTTNPEIELWLKTLIEDSDLDTQLGELAVTTSAYGDGALRILTGENKTVGVANEKVGYRNLKIQTLDAKQFYPEINKGNWRNPPTSIIIEWQESVKSQGKTQTYTIHEKHTPDGMVTYSYRLNSKTVSSAPFAYENYQIPVQGFTIEHIPNKRYNSYWGISDYADIYSLMFGLDDHMTGISEVIYKMIEPIRTLPRSVHDDIRQRKIQEARIRGDKNPESHGIVTPSDLAKYKVLFTSESDSSPQVITWDAQLTSAFTLVEKIEDSILKLKSIPKYLLDDGKDSGKDVSGVALERRIIALRKTIERKQRYYAEGLQNILYTAQQLGATGQYRAGDNPFPKGATPEKPSIVFADPLPFDLQGAINTQIDMLNNQLTSRQKAISEVQQISTDSANELKEIIDAEQEAVLRKQSERISQDI